jgi:hypothetical protein
VQVESFLIVDIACFGLVTKVVHDSAFNSADKVQLVLNYREKLSSLPTEFDVPWFVETDLKAIRLDDVICKLRHIINSERIFNRR